MAGTLSLSLPNSVFSLSPNTRGSAGNAPINEGWYSFSGGGNTDIDLITALESNILVYNQPLGSGIVTRTIKFLFDASSAIWSLDGNPPVAFAALPPGFLMRATLIMDLATSSNQPPQLFAGFRAAIGLNEISTDHNTSPSLFDELHNPGCPTALDGAYINPSQFLDGFLLLETTFSSGIIVAGTNTLAFQASAYSLEGDYVIFSFSYTFTPNPASIGDSVEMTGLSASAVISSLSLFNGSTFPASFSQVGQVVTLVVPAVPAGGDYDVIIDIVSDEFSGRVAAGVLTVLFADASGIYTLVPGKTTDTLYDRTGTTTEVKIPNPFAKTGFIGG